MMTKLNIFIDKGIKINVIENESKIISEKLLEGIQKYNFGIIRM